MPVVPARDPATAILADPQVPERRRFCGNPDCERPVGRGRAGQPGLVEGFCAHCGSPFSFVPRLKPGILVGGRYETLGCLAFGGLGWIYLARDKNVGDEVSDRWVVLKGLIDTGDPDAMAAAVTERRFLVEVDHPGIVKIHDFVQHAGVGYIVMEYVGGRSLKDLRLDVGGPLPLDRVLAYGLEILPAFGYLHDRGLLYCDFKPDNAIHTDDRLKLVDLGAVRREVDDVSAVWGTVGYQAPEVESVGPSVTSDLYTVARTMAVLSLDFRGFSSTYVDRLPDPVDAPLLAGQESYRRFLMRATHADPDRRFQSAAEMGEQLLGVLRQVLAAGGRALPPADSAQFTGERGTFGAGIGPVGSTADGTFDGAVMAAALPVPRADLTDPGASLLLTAQSGDLKTLTRLAASAPAGSTEVLFAVVRARIAQGDREGATADLDRLAAADPLDWRVGWYRGLAALAAGRPADAVDAFDAVYGALPGELAPQLAVAAAAEWAGDTARALRLYERVWRTDRTFVSAAFGQARILLAGGDSAGAIGVLDDVPASSSHHLTAQIAAARARVRNAAPASATDLVDAADRIERLQLDLERRSGLAVELFEAALDWLRGGRSGGTATLLGHPFTDRDLRFGLERAYRSLATLAPDRDARIALVYRANRVRPRTWL
jgi:serine/threonine-protein kinase PknG